MILANTNLSNLQSNSLLASLVILATVILSSFFLMIYSFSENNNKVILTSFWLFNFLLALTIFILIIFIFKDALDSYPCPIYISTNEDSTEQRNNIEKAINFYQNSSDFSMGKSIQNYVSTRNYVVLSTVYLKKLNMNTNMFRDLNILPLAYVIDKTFYSLRGVSILTI